jgi:hypothetical protein
VSFGKADRPLQASGAPSHARSRHACITLTFPIENHYVNTIVVLHRVGSTGAQMASQRVARRAAGPGQVQAPRDNGAPLRRRRRGRGRGAHQRGHRAGAVRRGGDIRRGCAPGRRWWAHGESAFG